MREYVFPEDVYNRAKMMDQIAEQFNHTCFVGHTHIAGMFRKNRDSDWQFISPTELPRCETNKNGKLICNVGSVGQPRDCDPRASFVTFDGTTICFHRVDYDIDATIAKVYAIPEIDDVQGDRLREGR